MSHQRAVAEALKLRPYRRFKFDTALDIESIALAIYDAKQYSTGAGSHALNTSGTYPNISQKFDVLGRVYRLRWSLRLQSKAKVAQRNPARLAEAIFPLWDDEGKAVSELSEVLASLPQPIRPPAWSPL